MISLSPSMGKKKNKKHAVASDSDDDGASQAYPSISSHLEILCSSSTHIVEENDIRLDSFLCTSLGCSKGRVQRAVKVAKDNTLSTPDSESSTILK